jgi:hypothetical protein
VPEILKELLEHGSRSIGTQGWIDELMIEAGVRLVHGGTDEGLQKTWGEVEVSGWYRNRRGVSVIHPERLQSVMRKLNSVSVMERGRQPSSIIVCWRSQTVADLQQNLVA